MEQAKEYYAFISYKSEDKEWAIWLQHELEHYHLPATLNGRSDLPQELRPIFRDLDELSAGNLPDQIRTALTNSANLIVVCSPMSAKSPWVNQEVETFIAMGKTKRIFPFIVEGHPFADNSDEECFPPAIQNLPKEEERLGGDVTKNGRDAAFVKVVAGMLGLGFDTLWNRYEKEKAEEERKQREQRDNLLRAQSLFISEKANVITGKGDSYYAQKILLEALPKKITEPDRPYIPEAEAALRCALQQNSTILKGHTDQVLFATYSPNGKLIASASGSEDNTIRLWDVNTGQCRRVVEGHSHWFNYVAFSPDNKKIVTASGDNTIRILDVDSGQCLQVLEGHTDEVSIVFFSPDGKQIISASFDGTVRMWGVSSGSCFRIIDVKGGSPCGFSPNFKNILSCSEGDVSIVDCRTGQCVHTFKVNSPDIVISAIFSPDGKQIVATTLYSDLIYIFDVATRSCIKKIQGHTDAVQYTSFSPDGKRLVSASSDRTIRIWDVDTGQCLQIFEGHTSVVESALFSADGNNILSASCDKTVRIWATNKELSFKTLKGHKDDVIDLSFSPDNRRLVSTSKDKTIRVWDILSLRCIQTIKDLRMETDSVSYINDGHQIVASDDSKIIFFDATTGECIKTIDNCLDNCFIPNGKALRTRRLGYGTNNYYDITTNQCYKVLVSHDYGYSASFFSCESKKILSSSEGLDDGTMYILDAITGGVQELKGHTAWVSAASYSPDGEKIVTSSNGDKTIRIWDAKTAQCLKIINIDKDYITNNSTCFSPDGSYIFSVLNDEHYGGNLFVWEVESGKCIWTLELHSEYVKAAVFSPNGRYIGLALDWGCVKIYDFPPLQELIDETRERFKDNPLTPEERRQYYLE